MRAPSRILFLRYGVPLALAALTALSLYFMRAFWVPGVFLLLLSAVVLSAWYGGLGPALLSTALSGLLYAYFAAAPPFSLELIDLYDQLRLLVFVTLAVLLSGLIEALHSAGRRAEAMTGLLRIEEEHHRRLVETTQEGIWNLDAAARIQSVNRRGAEMLGYPPGAMVGRLMWEFLAAGMRKEAQRSWERAQQGQREQQDWRFQRKDGSDLWAQVFLTPTFDPAGAFRGVLLLVMDVTERQRADLALRFIVDASQVLASSLEYDSTLRSVARLAVPALADWCAVDVLEDGDTIHRLAVVHTDPAKERLAWELSHQYPPERSESNNLYRVLNTGRSELYPQIPENFLQATIRDPERLESLRSLGLQSGMIVPLRVRGRTLGAITLATAESGRRYGPSDLTLAETLARRAALAVDNALLYREAQKEIAERKQAEEALRTSEERLRLALVAGRMGVWDLNVRTGELKWSDNLEPLHGLTPGTFGGTYEAFLELVHPQERERVVAAVTQALNNRTGYELEFRIVWPDDTIHWVLGKGQVFADESGQAVRMIGVGTDITARKEAEMEILKLTEVLRNQQKWLESVLDLMPSPMLFIEPGTARVTFANRAAHEVAGGEFPMPLSVEEYHAAYYCTDAEGKRIPDEQLPGVRAARGERLDRFEMNWRVPGDTRSLLLYADLLPAMHGHPATVVMPFQDITQLKQIEAELRRANQAKDQFLAMLGHELRNPLAPLLNALHLLRLGNSTPEALEDAWDMAQRQVQHMTRLIDDLLDVSRITRGKIQLRKELADLGAVVARAVETSRPLIMSRRHELEVSLPADPVSVEVDTTRLEQIVANLLNNAAKYTDEGGRIWLTAERSGSETIIRVRDTGIGIPTDMLPHIFEMFVQVEHSLDRTKGGLGIGLTLVRSLVEMHGGNVHARSAGPGQGSEFVVRLPLPHGTPAAEVLPAPVPIQLNGQPLRVLVVDDNVDAAGSLTLLLRAYGHEVSAAHDGQEALTSAAAFGPQVVLLDIGLPKLDGYEVARRLRCQSGLEKTLLVALTGYGQEQDRRRSHEAGFDRHLVKPVDPAELEQLLAAFHVPNREDQSASEPQALAREDSNPR